MQTKKRCSSRKSEVMYDSLWGGGGGSSEMDDFCSLPYMNYTASSQRHHEPIMTCDCSALGLTHEKEYVIVTQLLLQIDKDLQLEDHAILWRKAE